jgi:hypothetical protein
MTYEWWFEGEFGIIGGEINADNLEEAKDLMEKLFREDIGSDGELTDEDRNSTYIWRV